MIILVNRPLLFSQTDTSDLLIKFDCSSPPDKICDSLTVYARSMGRQTSNINSHVVTKYYWNVAMHAYVAIAEQYHAKEICWLVQVQSVPAMEMQYCLTITKHLPYIIANIDTTLQMCHNNTISPNLHVLYPSQSHNACVTILSNSEQLAWPELWERLTWAVATSIHCKPAATAFCSGFLNGWQ